MRLEPIIASLIASRARLRGRVRAHRFHRPAEGSAHRRRRGAEHSVESDLARAVRASPEAPSHLAVLQLFLPVGAPPTACRFRGGAGLRGGRQQPSGQIIRRGTACRRTAECGLMPLLGFDYRPQLADLPDAKLWRITPGAGYGPLSTAARGKIDLGRVRATCSASSVPSTPARSAPTTCCGCCNTGATRPSSAKRWRTTGGSSKPSTCCPTSIRRPTGRRSEHAQPAGRPPRPGAARLPRPPR